MDIGKAVVASLESIGELFVINPKAVQYSGVKVMHVHWIRFYIVTIIIGFPISDAWFDTAAGHPNGKAPWVVITAKGIGIALSINSAAKLTAPDDECLVEHVPSF